ncbi:MAG: Bacitracin transport permease protein BCRC [Parcubacteria group bacterium GW2011_GWF2_39_13b]|nr:MAG: Bacitracin transport permease protein BCRC [Parcubacteria group bacterium GW2011_GWF2_39_13b]
MNFDYFLFQQINNLAGRFFWLDKIAVFFAAYFQYFLVAGLLIFLVLGKDKENKIKNRFMVFGALLSAGIARLVFANIIRWLYYRPRPFIDHQVNQLLNHNSEGSFPSGHAVFFFALAMFIFYYNKRIGTWFFIGAVLISIARVFVGIHYPLDILAGALVGIIAGWLVNIIFEKIKKARLN